MSHKLYRKVIVLGNSGVGKTSLLYRYVKKEFQPVYRATLNTHCLNKEISLDALDVTLQIWDTAGTEQFDSIGRALYNKSDACVLVCDVTKKESLQQLEKWRKAFLKELSLDDNDENNSRFFIVIANKIDLGEERVVAAHEVKRYAENLRIDMFEASAKSGKGVEEAFITIARKAISNRDVVDAKVPGQLAGLDAEPEVGGCAC